jgi:hypothetical protein
VGLLAGLTAVGCGDDSPARKAPHVPLARGPALPAPSVSEPLPDVPGGVEHSPLTLEAPPMGYLVDARILVISPDGSDSELAAIRQTLAYLGVRYDVFVATTAPTLTMANLTSDPMHGFYNGIILTRGSMVLPSGGTSAFTAAEFQTLSNYEAQFQVRRVSLYTRPDAGYGYTTASANNSFTMSTTGEHDVHAGRARDLPVRELQQRRDQRRGRVPRGGRRRRDRRRADRFQRRRAGRDARLRRRPRGDVAELRAVAQPGAHAAAVPRRRQLGDARRVPGRATRVHRRPDR